MANKSPNTLRFTCDLELLAVEFLELQYIREGIYYEINDGQISDIGRD